MSKEKDYTLVALSLDGEDTAQKALEKIKELNKEKVIHVEDIVAVNKDEKGRVKLKQGRGLTMKKGSLGFGTAGLIGAAIVGGPVVLAAATGAAIGAASSQIKKIFDNDELKKMGEDLGPNSSLLFVVLSDFIIGSMESAMAEIDAKMNAFVLAEDGLVVMGEVSDNDAFLAVMTEDVIVIEEAELMDDNAGETCSTDATCEVDGTCCASDVPENTEEVK